MAHDSPFLARARDAARVIAPLAPAIESGRRLPPPALAALVRAGAFKLYVPRAYGGGEASLGDAIGFLEELGAADGSAAWCAMIGATSGLMAAFLDDRVARAMFAADDAITCGVFAPMGRATRVEGGYKVSGRWPFASGCESAAWRMGGAIVEGEEALPSGAPNVRSVIFSAVDTVIIDTWKTSGLRGTGSHDLVVTDAFVPADRTLSLLSDPPRHDAPLYRLPFFGVLAASIAAVALGIAQGAVAEFVRLAQAKKPAGSKRTLAHRETVQLDVADAEARLSAGRAFLREAVAEVEAKGAHPVSLRARARLRLAACHAVTEAAAAVDRMYTAAGASAVYETSPLQRQFRDVHVATQHLMVSRASAGLAGRVLLDVPSDPEPL